MTKRVTYRIIGLILILIASNYLYKYTLYSSDWKKAAPCAYQCRALPKNTDLVYFGESSNFTVDGNDSTQLYISELVQHFSPDLKLITIDTPAVHAGIYKYWIKQMTGNLPKGILVTMNLRSFDAAWIHSKLETPLIRSIRLLKEGPVVFNRFMLSAKSFEDKTPEEREKDMLRNWKKTKLVFPFDFKYKSVRDWDRAVADGSWLRPDGTWDTKRIELAAHYIKGFAFNINEQNPRIKDFDEIANWGKQNGVQVYFNILAENVAQADSLVGKELVFLMKNNRDYLKDRYGKMGAVVIDNLESAGYNDFLDKDWPTEHYNYKGRIAIAKKIVEHLKIK